jgi:hypothetical protein
VPLGAAICPGNFHELNSHRDQFYGIPVTRQLRFLIFGVFREREFLNHIIAVTEGRGITQQELLYEFRKGNIFGASAVEESRAR